MDGLMEESFTSFVLRRQTLALSILGCCTVCLLSGDSIIVHSANRCPAIVDFSVDICPPPKAADRIDSLLTAVLFHQALLLSIICCGSVQVLTARELHKVSSDGVVYAAAPEERGAYSVGETDGLYNYGYNTGDGIAKVEVGRPDGSVIGSYRYFDPNGKQVRLLSPKVPVLRQRSV